MTDPTPNINEVFDRLKATLASVTEDAKHGPARRKPAVNPYINLLVSLLLVAMLCATVLGVVWMVTT